MLWFLNINSVIEKYKRNINTWENFKKYNLSIYCLYLHLLIEKNILRPAKQSSITKILFVLGLWHYKLVYIKDFIIRKNNFYKKNKINQI